MSSHVSCVAFDVDDTLYLERDYVRSGLRVVDLVVSSDLSVQGFFDHAWTAFERGVRGRIFDAALRECGIEATPRLLQDLVSVYRGHDPDIELLSDARTCLPVLAERCALAVVTDGPAESQRAKLTALGTGRWMHTTILTDEIGSGFGKPHPRPFVLVQALTGSRAEDCVYVADNPAKDFSGPRTLGWRTVRVRRLGSLHDLVPSGSDVDHEIDDLGCLPDLLHVAGVT